MNHLTILASSAMPEGIRGALNKWFIEILPGIFVGTPSTRIREEIWDLLQTSLPATNGYAACIRHDPTREQHYDIRTIGQHPYQVRDFDGLQLVVRAHKTGQAALPDGLSALSTNDPPT